MIDELPVLGMKLADYKVGTLEYCHGHRQNVCNKFLQVFHSSLCKESKWNCRIGISWYRIITFEGTNCKLSTVLFASNWSSGIMQSYWFFSFWPLSALVHLCSLMWLCLLQGRASTGGTGPIIQGTKSFSYDYCYWSTRRNDDHFASQEKVCLWQSFLFVTPY